MVKVKKMPGESDESLIRKFTRKVLLDGVVMEAKRRKFHLKPSLAKKQRKKDKQQARALMTKLMKTA